MEAIARGSFRIAREPRAMVRWNIQPTVWRTFKRFRTYARHNIRAGLWKGWQAPILRYYLLLLLLALPAFFFGARWLLVTVAIWLLLLALRGGIALWRSRQHYPAGIARNAMRLFLLIPIIATLDAAALVGSVAWLLFDRDFITNQA
jgi:hypothetical protein